MLEVAIIAAVAGAIALHDFLSGERLLLDVLDELALSLTPLSWLAARWRRGARSDVVVTLTTIPSRVAHLRLTLKSLLRQTLPPKRIEVYLPRYSTRERREVTAPAWLLGIEGVDVIRCDDEGPATKLLPALRRHDARQRLLVVDDDRVYPARLLETLAAAANEEPDAVHAYGGWVAPADRVDRPTTLWANVRSRPPVPLKPTRLATKHAVDIVQGCAGFLTTPAAFDAGVFDQATAPTAARTADDVWLSAHCLAPKYVVAARRSHYQSKRLFRLYRASSLGLINRGPGPWDQRANSIMLRHFSERWSTPRASDHASAPSTTRATAPNDRSGHQSDPASPPTPAE